MGLSLGIRQDLLLGNTSLCSTSLGEGTGCCAYMKSRWGIAWRLDTSAGVSTLTRNWTKLGSLLLTWLGSPALCSALVLLVHSQLCFQSRDSEQCPSLFIRLDLPCWHWS